MIPGWDLTGSWIPISEKQSDNAFLAREAAELEMTKEEERML